MGSTAESDGARAGANAWLLGATGMLGRAMAAELGTRGIGVWAPTREELDLGKPDSIRRVAKFRAAPRYIINCAAWTDVDGAENAAEQAAVVNGESVAALAGMCGMDTTLLTFSTDYVFDGNAATPYPTDAPRFPINAYGRSKAAGEEALERRPMGWLNVRTSWLYAPWGKNFVLTMRKLLLERPQVRVVDDQRGRPTSAEHLARASLELLLRGHEGHAHVTDGGECSWYGLACGIREHLTKLGLPAGELVPCTSAEFPRPARRPAYSVLDISETEAVLGPMPPWQQNLAGVLSRVG